MREVSTILMGFSGCDSVELWLKAHNKYYRCGIVSSPKESFHFEVIPSVTTDSGDVIPRLRDNLDLERLCGDIFLEEYDPSPPLFTKNGSFWTGDTENPIILLQKPSGKKCVYDLGDSYRSFTIIPIIGDNGNIGLMQLRSRQKNFFKKHEIELYEGVAQSLAVALVNRSTQLDLRERVKELTCLYGIAQLVAQPDISLEQIMQGIAGLLPPAWLYTEIATARIILDGCTYSTSTFHEGSYRQMSDIIVRGERRGIVEVSYSEEKPKLDEGPFLKEERSLIDAVAREIALIIERKQAEEEKTRLQDQLRHADRLATIGQLAAGVAHELNEPLGSILGFAQLASKPPELPEQTRKDIEKIVTASLHAREVIRKLMTFARQTPPKKTKVDLNLLVEEGLYFLESRCDKDGIELVRSLSPGLPSVTADQAQLHQALVNLAVNAIQAMPEGGRLTIRTLVSDDHVSLIVEDTGMGMNEEIMKQIFVPFFTTKEVGRGTGLGLAVVHGIVSSHGGSIKVESEVDNGSRFEIQLPIRGSSNVEESDKDGIFR